MLKKLRLQVGAFCFSILYFSFLNFHLNILAPTQVLSPIFLDIFLNDMQLDKRLPLMQLACKDDAFKLKKLDDWHKASLSFLIRIIKEDKVLLVLVNIDKAE
jgi:hypothetical protein